MGSVSNAFSAVGTSSQLLVQPGNSITYYATGGATATSRLERSTSLGQTWETIASFTGDVGPVTFTNIPSKAYYRFRCTSYTSGTQTCTVKDTTEELTGVGKASTAGVLALHYGGPVFWQTRLEINDVTVTISDDAGVAQYGGVQVYDFPVGMINILGAQVNGILTAGVTGTIIDNWDGDVALGTVTATTGATLTGTEANIMQSVAVSAGASDKLGVVDAVSVATALTESGARWLDGTDTAIDMYLNFVIDDDATHTAGTASFTGTVVFNWASLGDN